MSDTIFIDGLYELMDSYDGFIMDQWGVLHDGMKPYPGALDVLAQLKAHKKQVVILSNSGKRGDYNKTRMKELGFKPTTFKSVVSAGEVTWQGLNERNDGIFDGLGDNVYLINRGGDRQLLHGLDLNVVNDVDDADFILITGVDAPQKTIEDYEPVLRKAVTKGLPAICANPDIVTVFGKERAMGPGAVAMRYSEFGGVAHFIGKPHKPIFRHCINLFEDVMPARILVIGDSLYHDIAGGMAVDLDTAFVTTGIHTNAFKPEYNLDQKQKNMEQLVQNYGARPKWVLNGMVWQTAEAALRERERARMKD